MPTDAVPGSSWDVVVAGELDLDGTTYSVPSRATGGPRSGPGLQASVAILQRPLTLAVTPEPVAVATSTKGVRLSSPR